MFDFSGAAAIGNTFIASVNSAADVTAEGGESGRACEVTGPPVTGNTMTIQNFGSLSVATGTNNPVAANLPIPPVTAPTLQVRLEASLTENVVVSSITFTASGTGNADSDISSVVLYNDLDASGTVSGGDITIGAATTFSSGSATFGGLAELITAGAASAENWLVVCTFSGGSIGDTYSLSLASNANVSAMGVISLLSITPTGAPVPGNTMTIHSIGTLTLSPGPFNPPAGNLPIPPNAVPMLQVNLSAGPLEDVDISSITFTAGGTGVPAAAISAVDLYRDLDSSGTLTVGDVPIGLAAVFVGGTVQFTGLTETITAGAASAEDWLVLCTFTGGNSGDTFSVSLAAGTDVTATGAVSLISITPTGAAAGNLMTMLAPPLIITTQRLPFAMNGVAYNFTLGAMGGTAPFNWTVSNGSLPTGLNLAAATGIISATPTAQGSIFTVQVTDAGVPMQTDTQILHGLQQHRLGDRRLGPQGIPDARHVVRLQPLLRA